MATDSDMVGNAVIRWSPTLTSDKRDEILRKMREIKPQRRRTAVNYDRARQLADARAELILGRPDQDDAPRVPWTVRVYYRSQGDEILCFEVRGLTEPRALALASECCSGRSDAVDADAWRESKEAPPLMRGARMVTLPSQSTETAVVSDSEPAAELPLVAAPTPPVSPVVEITRSFFSDAMRRRAERARRFGRAA